MERVAHVHAYILTNQGLAPGQLLGELTLLVQLLAINLQKKKLLESTGDIHAMLWREIVSSGLLTPLVWL